MRKYWDGEKETIKIDQADELVLASVEILTEVHETNGYITLDDEIVTFRDDYDQVLRYRIGDYSATYDGFYLRRIDD